MSQKAFLALFVLILASTAIFFGGALPMAQAILPVFCAVLLGVAAFAPNPTRSGWEPTLLVYGCFVPVIAVLAFTLVQLLPLDKLGLPSLINGFFSITPQPSPWQTISINPGLTLSQSTLGLGYLAFATAVYRMGRLNGLLTLKIIALTITALSFYGLFIFASGNGSVLWLPKVSYTDSLTATFINRNSYATFAGLGILACMGIFLKRIGEISSRLSHRQRFQAFWMLILKPGWPWLCAALVCLLALVLTNSRAGLLASLSGLVVLLGSLAGMRAPARWPLVGIIGLIFAFAIIVLGAVGDRVAERLQNLQLDSATRANIYATTRDVINQYPFTGTGFGTYQAALGTGGTPQLLSKTPYVVEHAHNTYLELGTELGYPSLLLLALASLSLITAFITGLINRRRAIMWPALGVATVTLVGSHALVDFSLSIPAVTLVTLSLIMLAFSQSFPERDPETTGKPKPQPSSLILLPLSLILLGAGGWQGAAAWQAYQAMPTLNDISSSQPVSVLAIRQAQQHLQSCLAINSYNPTCGLGLAQTNLSLATLYGLTGPHRALALVYLFTAKQQYEDALTKAPVNPYAWYRLARINAYTADAPAAINALANSILTGPAEPGLAFQRVPLMLSLMPQADNDNRNLFIANILGLWNARPWSLAPQIQKNPTVQPAFARLLGDSTLTRTNWQHFIGTPYPSAQAPAPIAAPVSTTEPTPAPQVQKPETKPQPKPAPKTKRKTGH